MDCTPRHLYLSAPGARLHTACWPGPTDAPPLLVLHGIWESWRTFAPSAERWSAQRSVYCVDLRGHGTSDRPASGYRFRDYAADVRAILPALGPVVDVLGHSLGGAVALHVAAGLDTDCGPGRPPVPDDPACAARIRRLITVEPPVLLPDDWPPVRTDMARYWKLSRRPVDEIVAQLPSSATRTERWQRMIAEALAETDDGVFRAMVHGEQGEVDWPALLARIATPTMAIAGDPNVPGALLTGARLETLAAGLPSARVAVLPGSGHHVELDCTAGFHALVEEFLT
jgi:pimeloyl-ACP methyl ester carboxylesterase